ncbi:putative class III chitinase [Xylaria intraflava]|nr:putative class III chitinase [Xylaria intraflava]
MAPSFLSSFAGLLALTPAALAGFNPKGVDNLSVYWGQNSAGGASTQGDLKTYCDDNGINIINLAFMDAVNTPTVNFASSSNACTPISGTQLLRCPQIESDIQYCQGKGKTIILSIGGATYSEGGFSSESVAQSAAKNVWSLFGSDTSAKNRPFGKAVVDGFDFDLESSNQNFPAFAQQLRDLMDADKSKSYYLSAAPQCVFPDAADNAMLNGVISFDWINVQFYNNNCGLGNFNNPNAWNFATWDNWAKKTSKNPNVRVLIGAPAGAKAAGSGFVDASTLSNIVKTTASKYSSFGGVMLWDMSVLFQDTSFLKSIVSALGGSSSGGSTGTTTAKPTTAKPTTAKPTTMATSTKSASSPSKTGSSGGSSGGSVAQWGQCGGQGYTGPTACASPYKCTSVSSWWSQCE